LAVNKIINRKGRRDTQNKINVINNSNNEKLLILLTAIFFTPSLTFSKEEKQEKKEMKPALLVIDTQKEYMPMMSEANQEQAIEMMNWSIWVFRKFNLTIIQVYHTNPEWGS